MNKPFHEQRRQVFMTEPFFIKKESFLSEELAYWQDRLIAVGDSESERRMLTYMENSDLSYELFSLRYTAGIPIEELRPELTGVIEALEAYQKAVAAYREIPEIAPLGMGRLDDYERCMQLIGLCYLLHRRDLLPRIAALQDPGYFGEDALYEDLLRYTLYDRVDTDEMLHIETYDPLLGTMYGDNNNECVLSLNDYLNQWYPAFKYAPWHDGHLDIDGTEGYYFGYWAFEAGAVALLCNIDDSQINHMIYPKDLVAWARDNAARFPDGGRNTVTKRRPNVPAGNPCPETGWWFTPAQANSRRYFQAGAIMPAIENSAYGSTYWQRSPDQSAPKL